MKTVLVTGANGFIGKNLIAKLEQNADIKIHTFVNGSTIKELESMILESDFIFHLAGVNRPKEDSEFTTGNKVLTEKITELLIKNSKKTPVLCTSSIQAEQDNAYGKSKKAAEDALFAYSKKSGGKVFIYRLPNIFGKWCRPNYNSVVATFCHNIANDLPVTINDPNYELNLAYIDEVVSEFYDALEAKVTPNKQGFCTMNITYKTTLQKLNDDIIAFKNSRLSLTVPNLDGDYPRYLYATFISYLPTDVFSYKLKTNIDDRGWLAEFIKSKHFGQIFVSKTKPGISRGNHWHNTKIEKFLVVEGEAEITFRKLNESEVVTYTVSGEQLTVLDIPTGYVHAIKNIGTADLITIFWADEILDQNKPDTIYQQV